MHTRISDVIDDDDDEDDGDGDEPGLAGRGDGTADWFGSRPSPGMHACIKTGKSVSRS